MDMMLAGSGNVTENFDNYTQQVNLDLIRCSHYRFGLKDEILEQISKYPESFTCEQ